MKNITQTSDEAAKATIADQGRKAAAGKKTQSIALIRKAMRKIEIDIERNGGLYPYAEGVISADEVVRRAGKSEGLLQKERHHVLRDEVNDWVDSVREAIASGRSVVRRKVSERVDLANKELKAIQQRWAEAELEYIETVNELAACKDRLAALELENARLRAVEQ
ncbi:hypothetical protein GCM10007937_54900 [Mesorhizobium albiziae]|nr:hypothetical protein GCM10007937_54900 [Mesorhizobium albiziae]